MTPLKLLLPAVALLPLTVSADVKLPSIFGDHMAVQRDVPLKVFGTATPGEAVTVQFDGHEKQTTATPDGKWALTLAAVKDRGPYEMTVRGSQTKTPITFTDVIAGEVWLCTGQSNMGFSVDGVNNADAEKKAADYPDIRLFDVKQVAKSEPQADVTGSWRVCKPDNVGPFSAVGYFFARDLHETLKVPVGLIADHWGGSNAESWTPLAAMTDVPSLKPIVVRYAGADVKGGMAKYERDKAAFEKNTYRPDPGDPPTAKHWMSPTFDDSAWKTMKLPSTIESNGEMINGAIWFRRTLDVPAGVANKQELTLHLGKIDDGDATYVNGTKVGATPPGEGSWSKSRDYALPPGVVKPGKNVIAVRVYDAGWEGGFTGPAGAMQLTYPSDQQDAADPIPLAGDWKYKVSVAYPAPAAPPQPPAGPNQYNSPANHWNGMVAPIAGYSIRGAIWYQGESNASRAEQYETLLPAMIGAWRAAWGQGDFPFLIVQIANFHDPVPEPVQPSEWAELQNAQRLIAAKVPNSGLVITNDVGDAGNIHPTDKQTVGLRAAKLAESAVYGEDVVGSGPLYQSVKFDGKAATVTFTHADGLHAKPGNIEGFALAGADRQWHPADAAVSGEKVVLTSDAVTKPVAVRYAWKSNAADANLYNAAGFPTSIFRTDDWPVTTAGKR